MNFPAISFTNIAKNFKQYLGILPAKNQPKSAKSNADKVVETANGLMLSNGKTTTLDVKNELRKNGSLITQKEVSIIMTAKTKEYRWTRTYNGQFKTYYPS